MHMKFLLAVLPLPDLHKKPAAHPIREQIMFNRGQKMLRIYIRPVKDDGIIRSAIHKDEGEFKRPAWLPTISREFSVPRNSAKIMNIIPNKRNAVVSRNNQFIVRRLKVFHLRNILKQKRNRLSRVRQPEIM